MDSKLKIYTQSLDPKTPLPEALDTLPFQVRTDRNDCPSLDRKIFLNLLSLPPVPLTFEAFSHQVDDADFFQGDRQFRQSLKEMLQCYNFGRFTMNVVVEGWEPVYDEDFCFFNLTVTIDADRYTNAVFGVEKKARRSLDSESKSKSRSQSQSDFQRRSFFVFLPPNGDVTLFCERGRLLAALDYVHGIDFFPLAVEERVCASPAMEESICEAVYPSGYRVKFPPPVPGHPRFVSRGPSFFTDGLCCQFLSLDRVLVQDFFQRKLSFSVRDISQGKGEVLLRGGSEAFVGAQTTEYFVDHFHYVWVEVKHPLFLLRVLTPDLRLLGEISLENFFVPLPQAQLQRSRIVVPAGYFAHNVIVCLSFSVPGDDKKENLRHFYYGVGLE